MDIAEQGSIGLLDFLYPELWSVAEERFFRGIEVRLGDRAGAEEVYAHVFESESEIPDEELAFRESAVYMDDQTMVLVLQCDSKGKVSTRRVCFQEPVETTAKEDADSKEKRKEWTQADYERNAESWLHVEERSARPAIRLRLDPETGPSDALPSWTSRLDLDLVPEELTDDPDRSGEVVRRYQHGLINLLTRLLVVPGRILARELENIRHIGPLRKIPPRNHRPKLTPDRARWSDGLAAWDTLYTASNDVVKRASGWLSRAEDGLATGYGIYRRRFRELPSDGLVMRTLLEDDSPLDQIELIRELIENIPEEKRLFLRDEDTLVEVEPHDIAVGITQVVPVVVAAIDGYEGITTIEQPELHNHPSVEVGLGDLFISTIAEEQEHCRFFLETHGEHLILRMLRRIRETSENELPEGHRGLKPDEIAVYYVERNSHGVKVHQMRIDETGEFIDKWPKGGFFRERAKELF